MINVLFVKDGYR